MAVLDSFDSAAARVWKSKVDTEIQEIETLLGRVAEVTTAPLFDDDPVMKAIQAIGENERKIWAGVTRTFSEVSERTQQIISEFEKFGDAAIDRVNQLVSRRG